MHLGHTPRRFFILCGFLCICATFSFAQPCGPNTPSFTVNLTGFPAGSWTSPSVVRDDQCCGVTPPDRCVEFWVTLDPGSQGIRFDISSGAIPPGALFYQLNCANPTAVGDTMCINGVGPHRITFCKPGNNQNTYTITSIPAPSAGPPIAVSNGCTGIIFATGYDIPSMSWTSVPSNPTYNSYLSCMVGCDTVVVTAQPGYPPSVLYQVCGYPLGGCQSMLICDTVRVYFISDKTATITPPNPVICFGGPPAVLTANGTGGAPPYFYSWSTGATTQSISVGAGTYWVQISDSTNCPPVYDTITVIANPSPISANAGPDDTICVYNGSFQLNGSVVVATGGVWSGGTGTFSPNNTTLNATYTPSPGEIAAGTVTLVLTTTGNGPCPASTDTVTLYISAAPVAAFSATSACLNQTTAFTDQSTTTLGTIVSWSWNFGDASASTQQNPTHIYTSAGNYTVTLIVSNSAGCLDTISQNITVHPLPSAAFGNTAQCFVDSVFFTDLSTISSGTITTWSWNFGDASASTQQNPSHFYAAPGSYTVTLIVGSSFGCTDTTSMVITVQPSPVAVFNAPPVCFNGTTVFTDSSYISSGSIVSWSWNFGDASTSTLQNPTHLYSSPGSYNVTLIVTSAAGCIDTLVQQVVVNPLPVVALGADLSACDSVVLNAGNPGLSYLWSNSATTQTITVYAGGSYSVVVTDANGCTGTDAINVIINSAPMVTLGNDVTQCGGTVTLNAGNPGSSYLWSDGSTTQSLVVSVSGSYTVTVTDVNGCTGTDVLNVTINPVPNAAFAALGACLADGIQFQDNSTVASGSIVSWQWFFGDLGQDSVQNPLHYYAATGNYAVTLIVTTNAGCMDTITQAATVNPSPTAGFTADQTIVVILQTVNFYDNSVGAVSWYWDFGDSTGTSTLQNPSYNYTSGGTYTVMQVVTNSFGCTDTAFFEVIVTMPPVVPNGFSPNGDGKNDVLYVLGGPYKFLEFSIYNNWGELIFKSNNQAMGWDGTRDGVRQPMSVYVYTVIAVTEDDKEHKLEGDVTLLR
ncbi:MAG: PKD domain-containing protein [Bacteroidota bacterium]